MKFYVYYWGHNGDALSTRAILRLLPGAHIGCPSNHAYLFEDLDVWVVPAPFGDYDLGSLFGVIKYHTERAVALGCQPLSAWCGTYPDLDVRFGHSWQNLLNTVNRQLLEIDRNMLLPQSQTPMLDFDLVRSDVPTPHPDMVPVYLENGVTRSGHGRYEFDVTTLGTLHPNVQFFCTAKPPVSAWPANVVDCSIIDLVSLSKLSERCRAIVGKGSGPFFCTFTEANRTKPRCVMGYETLAPHKGPFWPYDGQNTVYLKDGNQLHRFLKELS